MREPPEGPSHKRKQRATDLIVPPKPAPWRGFLFTSSPLSQRPTALRAEKVEPRRASNAPGLASRIAVHHLASEGTNNAGSIIRT